MSVSESTSFRLRGCQDLSNVVFYNGQVKIGDNANSTVKAFGNRVRKFSFVLENNQFGMYILCTLDTHT